MTWRVFSLAIFSATFFLLGRPANSGAEAGKLAALERIAVVVEELSWEARTLGLATAEVKDHLIDRLRSKIPQMVIDDSASEFIDIVILLGPSGGETGGNANFAGLVSGEVYRRVKVHATGMNVAAVVWRDLHVIQGRFDSIVPQVYQALDLFVGTLATAWDRENP